MNYEIFKNKFLRKTLASWCAFAMLMTMCGPAFAATAVLDQVGGQGGASYNNIAGGGTFSPYNGTSATFTGTGTQIIDWQNFNVMGGQSLTFNAGSVYNVANSMSVASQIAGAIDGTANVYVFNPNGVMFGNGAVINVEGVFGAFAQRVENLPTDWSADVGSWKPTLANPSGDITVNGGASISAAQIALAGKNVTVGASGNEATLDGAVAIAAGSEVVIDGFGGGTISMKLGDGASDGAVEMFAAFEDSIAQNAGLAIDAAGSVSVQSSTKIVIGDGGMDPAKGNVGLTAGGTTTLNSEMDVVVAEQVTVKDGDLAVTAGDDPINPGAFHVDNATIDVKGAITATAGGAVNIQGKSTVQATGDITLNANGGNFEMSATLGDDKVTVQSTEGNVAITAYDAVLLKRNAQVIGKGASVTAGGNTEGYTDISMSDGAKVETTDADGELAMVADKGSITESDDSTIEAQGKASFTATEGDVSLIGTANDFSKGGDDKVVDAEAKTVTINEGAGDISLGTVEATEGDVKVTDAAGTITVVQSVVAEDADANVVLTAQEDIKVAGEVAAGNDVTMKASGDYEVTESGTVEAGNDIDETIGGDSTVSGTEKAGNDVSKEVAGTSTISGQVSAGDDVNESVGVDYIVQGEVDAGNDVSVDTGRDLIVEASGSVTAGHNADFEVGRDKIIEGIVTAQNDVTEIVQGDVEISGTVEAGRDVTENVGGNLSTPDGGKIIAGNDLIVDVGTSTPEINISVGKGISAASGERSIAFNTVGGNGWPEVYGNGSKTLVLIDGRIAGGNSADQAIMQGVEFELAKGNSLIAPVFTYAANIFPMSNSTDMQSGDADFTQSFLTSDKGEIAGVDKVTK